jgi:hypothetical protein
MYIYMYVYVYTYIYIYNKEFFYLIEVRSLMLNRIKKDKIGINYKYRYGPAVYNEAVYDPLVTLRNDTLPRFKTSVIYQVL